MIFIRFFERGRCWGFQIDGDEEMKCIARAKAPTKMKRRAAAARISHNKTHCISLNCKMYFYKFKKTYLLKLQNVLMQDTTKIKRRLLQENLAIKLTGKSNIVPDSPVAFQVCFLSLSII